MRIWVDADACPNAIKEVIYRAAQRVQIETTLVSNKRLRIPSSPCLRTIQVAAGFNVADEKIAELLQPGDLVITDDIPCAASIIERGGAALSFRGELYTGDNISERLSIRNFMDGLRTTGVETGGPSSYHPRDRQAFANALDRFLTRYL